MIKIGSKVKTNKKYEDHMKKLFPETEGFNNYFWKEKSGIVTGISFFDSIEINGNDSIAECFLDIIE